MGRHEYKKEKTIIESYGAMGGLVTGSCHMFETRGSKILIDVGMFQGHNEERSKQGERRNFMPMSNIAKGVTDILITHAHIDHTGRLPMIYEKGFKPTTLATDGTAAFMVPMLKNSAEIQLSEQNEENRLYDMNDVEKAIRNTRAIKPFKKVDIGQNNSGMSAEFILNGHITGSSSILIRNPNSHENILFTGDMGKPNQSLCGGYRDFIDNIPKDPINVLVIESTSFDKEPVSFKEKENIFVNKINDTFENGGNVVIPVLSNHRMPEVLEVILNSIKSHKLPSDTSIIIDSPLGVDLMSVYEKIDPKYISRGYGDDLNFYKTDEESMARFDLVSKDIKIIGSHKESVSNDKEMSYGGNKTIILASGGMGEHGRSVNYLKGKFSKNYKNLILYTCHQVEGTYGSNMLFKKEHTREKETGAKVYKVDGFSSHASGSEEVFGYVERYNLEDLRTILIGHGKESSRVKMADEFSRRGYKAKVIMPDIRQLIEIWN